jgi:hypothetical protein
VPLETDERTNILNDDLKFTAQPIIHHVPEVAAPEVAGSVDTIQTLSPDMSNALEFIRQAAFLAWKQLWSHLVIPYAWDKLAASFWRGEGAEWTPAVWVNSTETDTQAEVLWDERYHEVGHIPHSAACTLY